MLLYIKARYHFEIGILETIMYTREYGTYCNPVPVFITRKNKCFLGDVLGHFMLYSLLMPEPHQKPVRVGPGS